MSAGGESARARAARAIDGPRAEPLGRAPSPWALSSRGTRPISAFRVLGRLTCASRLCRGPRQQKDKRSAPSIRRLSSSPFARPRLSLPRPRRSLRPQRATEERQRTLITTDATTKQTLDNAEQARAGAEASVARAQANLTKAIEQLRLCAAQGRFRRRRHRGWRGSRAGGLAWPKRRDGCEARRQGGGRRYRRGFPACRLKLACHSPSACSFSPPFRSKATFARSLRRRIRVTRTAAGPHRPERSP